LESNQQDEKEHSSPETMFIDVMDIGGIKQKNDPIIYTKFNHHITFQNLN